MDSKPVIPLPWGYESWLDYAVETCDVGQMQLFFSLSDDDLDFTKDELREAVRAELRELRARAAGF